MAGCRPLAPRRSPGHTGPAKPSPMHAEPSDTPLTDLEPALELRAADANTGTLPVDLVLATHLSVVCRMRIEFNDRPPLEAPLVISRRHCRGNRPARVALIDAARSWLCQRPAGSLAENTQVLRWMACVNGQWHAFALAP